MLQLKWVLEGRCHLDIHVVLVLVFAHGPSPNVLRADASRYGLTSWTARDARRNNGPDCHVQVCRLSGGRGLWAGLLLKRICHPWFRLRWKESPIFFISILFENMYIRLFKSYKISIEKLRRRYRGRSQKADLVDIYLVDLTWPKQLPNKPLVLKAGKYIQAFPILNLLVTNYDIIASSWQSELFVRKQRVKAFRVL